MFSRLHALVFRLSGGRLGRRWSGAPVLVLRTVGRKSGQPRATPVVYLRDGENLVVLPAAAGSDRTPAWWLNLQAEPRATAVVGGHDQRDVTARVADEREHRELWLRFAEIYPDIEQFRGFTVRELPLVILEPRSVEGALPAGGSRRTELGEHRSVRLVQGEIHYRERGHGPVLLFVHGLWVNGDLWRGVVEAVADRYRCITPDWPFGAHVASLAENADLSPSGVGDLIAAFIDALDVDDVTVVANDTGVAFVQVFVARHPHKLARLVLTPGDVAVNFLPLAIKWMRLVAWVPGAMLPLARFWNSRLGRRVIMFPLARQRPPATVLDSWFLPATRDRRLRGDLAKLLRAASPRATIAAGKHLSHFHGPALIVWTASENLVFPLRHGRRLQRLLPGARLELVAHSRAFVPEDQPQRLAELIDRFMSHSPTQPRSAPPSTIPIPRTR